MGESGVHEARDSVFMDVDNVVVDFDVKSVIINGVFPNRAEIEVLQVICLV